jgi:hypothetical protein
MKHYNPEGDLHVITIETIHKIQREPNIIKIFIMFILLVASFDYLADMG